MQRLKKSQLCCSKLSAQHLPTKLIPKTSEVRFIVDQGVEMRRPSQIHVEVKRSADGAIGLRIGGQCVIVGEGQIALD
jgi:predicted PhzF superfamily epimerase YddE/YHI9